jgi:hypothetical protein
MLLVIVMMMIVIVMTAAALVLLMIVMVVMLVIVMTAAALMLFMVMMVVMLVIVMTAAALMLLVIVMMMLVVMVTAAALVLLVIVMVVMLVMTAAALMLFMVMMVVMMLVMFLLQLGQFCCQGSLTFHSLDQLLAGELIPGGGDDGSLLIMLPDQGDGGIQLVLGGGVSTGQDDGGSGFDLVVVELTEVLHVNLHLACIADSHGIAQGDIFIGHLPDRADHIGQLANTGGLNHDPVGVILFDDLGQGLAEVTNQAAADAAGVHFGNVDAGILQKTAVDADLAEFILNQNQLFALVGFLDHLFDEGSFTGTQKAGININFGHIVHLSIPCSKNGFFYTYCFIITPCPGKIHSFSPKKETNSTHSDPDFS